MDRVANNQGVDTPRGSLQPMMGRRWGINAQFPHSRPPGIPLCPTQPPRGGRRETCSLKTLVDSGKGFIVEGASCEAPPPRPPVGATDSFLHCPRVLFCPCQPPHPCPTSLSDVPRVLSSPFSTPMPHSPQQTPCTLSPERRNHRHWAMWLPASQLPVSGLDYP